jgi:hypothetical protein
VLGKPRNVRETFSSEALEDENGEPWGGRRGFGARRFLLLLFCMVTEKKMKNTENAENE